MEHDNTFVKSANIGQDTIIWQFTIVLPGAIIGRNCNINSHCFIENDVKIGDNVTVKCGVYIWDGIRIEDNAFIGPNVTFINDKHPRSKKTFEILKTEIRFGASIGANSTILPGLTVGRYAMIGAGSTVTKDVPDNTLWRGNPARQVGFICNCGQRLNNEFCCESCESCYKFDNHKIMKI
jgi:acetyltransferase-like isoleucine patch superfamily enzyme